MPVSIADATAVELRNEAARAIHESVSPAYARLLKFFVSEYQPRARASIAAYALSNGRAYYRQQVREFTTLNATPEEEAARRAPKAPKQASFLD